MSTESGKDEGDLRTDLGLTEERGDELVRIVQIIMDHEIMSDDGCGRTSHVLLDIAGRKDLSDVEKAACVFLFSTRILRGVDTGIIGSTDVKNVQHRIGVTSVPMRENDHIKTKEFLDLEEGVSGMVISSEGVEDGEMASVIMATLVSMLRQMSKGEAQEFCRSASLAFARMATTGDIRL